jgi:predicted nucleic acid-binding protein
VKVLVDTSIWSLSLRRSSKKRSGQEWVIMSGLEQLAKDGRAAMIGPVRQELLSGIRATDQFDRLRNALRAFPDEPLSTEDYETAAQLTNRCLSAGIGGSAIDLLICAVAQRRDWPIYTSDRDFHSYARVADIRLYETG